METKELRLGNYVSNGENAILVDCHTIYDNTVICTGLLKPIPLTEEWLIYFGFIKGEDSYSFRGFFLENRNTDPFLPQLKREKLKDSFGVWRNNNFLTNIKHVHQLQNLYFVLTNEELTAKTK
jgi:hypothetical protein